MKVIATKLGYYDHKRRAEGAIFELKKDKEFSPKWMDKVDEDSEELGVQPKKSGRPVRKVSVVDDQNA